MKIITYLTLLTITVSGLIYSQIRHDRIPDRESKIERLEKIKLIEVLELDEETSIRFFARRSEHRREIHELQLSVDSKLAELEEVMKNKQTDDKKLKEMLSDYYQLEENIFNHRMSFLESLNDILTRKQITRLIIFERRFREELKDVIIRDRQRRKK